MSHFRFVCLIKFFYKGTPWHFVIVSRINEVKFVRKFFPEILKLIKFFLNLLTKNCVV